ncbi:hypothetical protein CVT24_002453, partial [Panaeolus cyanescens]
MYSCVTGCNYSSQTQTNLSKHQKYCSHVASLRQPIKDARQRLLSDSNAAISDLKRARNEMYENRFSARITPTVLPESPQTEQNQLEDANSSPANTQTHLRLSNPVLSLDQHAEQSESHESTVPPVPLLTATGRPRRAYREPARFRDRIPESMAQSLDLPPQPEPTQLPRVILVVRDRLVSLANAFGIWRDYPRRPTVDPDTFLTLEDLSNTSYSSAATNHALPASSNQPPPRSEHIQFENRSIELLMKWVHNGNTQKSEREIEDLLNNVLRNPDFSLDQLPANFSIRQENQRIDQSIEESTIRSQFKEVPIHIAIPSGSKSIKHPTMYHVPGFLCRKITDVIKEAFNHPLACHFHYSPFRLFRKSPTTNEDERIYGELYSSKAFEEAHEDVQRRAPLPADQPNCKLEKVVAALMFSSDATHLAKFGNTTAWPIYMMLGNLSKYFRALPNSGAMHHLAYIPKLPDDFSSVASNVHAKWKTQHRDILTHCRRDLMHAVWRQLLDEDFIHAYTYGMVIMCADGVQRRVYPRIFTYSADYPEKVLLATIRDKGLCPCPRCLVAKSDLDGLGLPADTATRLEKPRAFEMAKVKKARIQIYSEGQPIGGKAVEDLLKGFSGVPTLNAFADRIPKFDPSRMLTVDLLHEFELGVWKALFTHLIRILHASKPGSEAVIKLDSSRYREIPTFGQGTIRAFTGNASDMKKLAARDFEDLLQCALPAFQDIVDEPHNTRIMKVLYHAAEWHALAKLRMHTDSTLTLLERITCDFAALVREFRNSTCSAFATVELPREAEARQRRELKDLESNGTSSSRQANQELQLQPQGKKVADHIRRFGTSDSYSTQLGEVAHRLLKAMYSLTNKKDALKQIGKKITRHHALQSIDTAALLESQDSASHPDDSSRHHVISSSRNKPVQIFSLGISRPLDPARKDFVRKLKEHLFRRLTGTRGDSTSEEERNSVRIAANTVFRVQTARIYYTTYDVRRDSDTINPRTHPFILCKSPDAPGAVDQAHWYWYAAMLGIFHTNAQICSNEARVGDETTHIEFLWVRWLEAVEDCHGRRYGMLPRLRFVPDTEENAFGFLDPAL